MNRSGQTATAVSMSFSSIIVNERNDPDAVCQKPRPQCQFVMSATDIYQDLSSCFRSNTEGGLSTTNGSIRSAWRVAHSIQVFRQFFRRPRAGFLGQQMG